MPFSYNAPVRQRSSFNFFAGARLSPLIHAEAQARNITTSTLVRQIVAAYFDAKAPQPTDEAPATEDEETRPEL